MHIEGAWPAGLFLERAEVPAESANPQSVSLSLPSLTPQKGGGQRPEAPGTAV